VNWITYVRTNPGSSAVTGWREPISISGQGKAALALYSAGGLVFFRDPTAISQAGDLRFAGIAVLNAPPN
jgi:hypothetical protein